MAMVVLGGLPVSDIMRVLCAVWPVDGSSHAQCDYAWKNQTGSLGRVQSVTWLTGIFVFEFALWFDQFYTKSREGNLNQRDIA